MNKENLYTSSFCPSQTGMLILERGHILAEGETPELMINRVVNDIAQIERKFLTSDEEIGIFAYQLGCLMDEKKIVFSTPIMTNAFREEKKPLSACTVPKIDLRKDLDSVKRIIDSYHQDAMGTGFNLSDTDDPVASLLYLNEVAVNGSKSGKEDRPVGNIAICRVDHPRILEFVSSKKNNPNIEWKFNISVDTPKEFWEAVENDNDWKLSDGQTISAKELLRYISESVYDTADPGIIFLDRLNIDNPTPGVGLYTATAPCAEVGLVPGETCQFGYININAFIKEDGSIDYQELSRVSEIMVRALDNVVELSIERYSVEESAEIMLAKRKIGVGICGLADMLINLGIPYSSNEARELTRDIISFVNYRTKLASVELAKTRGSFGAMMMNEGCRYNLYPGFIEQKYGELETRTVSSSQWIELGNIIRESKLLRNCSTTALPPTGRSGLVIDASTGIEPLFSLSNGDQLHHSVRTYFEKEGLLDSDSVSMVKVRGSCQETNLPEGVKDCLKTAVEISSFDHLEMISSIQPCIDESVSKTINLPFYSTPSDIEDIYLRAYRSGLKGITVYRDGSIKSQPKKLS